MYKIKMEMFNPPVRRYNVPCTYMFEKKDKILGGMRRYRRNKPRDEKCKTKKVEGGALGPLLIK